MSIFEATGQDVLTVLNEEKPKKNEENKVDFKKLYINLKPDESVTVRFLSDKDVKQYKSHGNFNLKLYNQTCTKKATGRCAYCEAHQYAKDNHIAEWEDTYAKNRFLFGMYDLDEKAVRIFNASKTQAKVMYGTIAEYKEDLDLAFKLSRMGEKVETTYTLSAQVRLKNEAHKKALEASNGLQVDSETFESALIVRSYNGQVKHLKELGFPNPEIFQTEQEAPKNANEIQAFEVKDEALPF